MMPFFANKGAVAQYVADQLLYLGHGSQWTMTITAGKYEDFCVRTTTGESLDVTEESLAEFVSSGVQQTT